MKELPDSEKAPLKDLQKLFWNKSGGDCFLCGGKMNQGSETLVPDHDIPEHEGGPTELSNLNLVHDGCNSFKRNHKSVDVRPYLKLLSKMHQQGGLLKYNQASKLLGAQPKPVQIKDQGNQIEVVLPTGEQFICPVFEETNKAGDFRFAFADVGMNCIFNDDECQPRTIKPTHLWQIYNDIGRNPLHEQPACRAIPADEGVGIFELRMFDGQHKTLAFWIDGRKSVTMKIYLNLTKEAAVRLVNSVQAKIKKLPLSPFELSAKMAEEWQERVSDYEAEVGTGEASEAGFIKWVAPDERARAKAAFLDALYHNILDDENLNFKNIISRPGQDIEQRFKITEAAFKNKILKPLLHVAPLEEKFGDSQKLRDREATAITRLLNIVYSKVFENPEDMSPQDEKRAKRFSYQSALNYCSGLLRALVGARLMTTELRAFVERDIDQQMWDTISEDIDRLLDHPVWTADLSQSDKTKAVELALSKNQNASQAFAAVGLKTGYVAGMDKLDPSCLD